MRPPKPTWVPGDYHIFLGIKTGEKNGTKADLTGFIRLSQETRKKTPLSVSMRSYGLKCIQAEKDKLVFFSDSDGLWQSTYVGAGGDATREPEQYLIHQQDKSDDPYRLYSAIDILDTFQRAMLSLSSGTYGYANEYRALLARRYAQVAHEIQKLPSVIGVVFVPEKSVRGRQSFRHEIFYDHEN